MSEAILTGAAELNRQLLNSAEYSAYLDTRKKLEEYPKYMEMVDSFRKKQVEFEIGRLNGEPSDTNEFALMNDYADICLISVCNDFFQAEMELLELIKAVNNSVFAGLDVGV